jgi:hypothetical protein
MFPTPQFGPSIVVPSTLAKIDDDYEAGSTSGTWEVDERRINRTYTNRVKLVVNSRYVGTLGVIAFIGSKIGDTYRYPLFSPMTEQDTGSFVQSIRPEKSSEHSASGQINWTATIEYGPFDTIFHLGSAYLSTGQIDPTAHVLEIAWSSAKYEVTRPYDFGDPKKFYLNTVGDPLVDPPPYEETRSVLKILRREPFFDEVTANLYRNTINQDIFLNCPPNTVKCRDICAPEREYDPDWGLFWPVSYEFEFRVDPNGDGFKQLIANMGLRYKNSAGKLVNVTDDKHQQANDAMLLSKDGSKLAAGADPYMIEFTGFPVVPFEGLNIPQDILQQSI